MREVEVGCKIAEGGQMEGFGDQEVADLLRDGWRVVSIRSKGALVRRMPSTGGEKRWGFVGFGMVVQLEEPDGRPVVAADAPGPAVEAGAAPDRCPQCGSAVQQ